jgi:alpha-glucosidase
MGYSFDLLSSDSSAAYIRATVEALEAKIGAGWPCWAISNHDVERVLTRWGNGLPSPDLAKLLTAMVCSLRGTACIYQGEELGLTEAEVPFTQLRDPYGIAFWPNFKGRDGCRTPIPWDGGANASFSSGKPWLPVPPEHHPLSVTRQERDPDSTLHGFRAFVHWRSTQAALRLGDIRFVDTPEPVLAFTRTHAQKTVVVALNLGANAIELQVPEGLVPKGAQLRQLAAPGPRAGRIEAGRLHLPPHAAIFATVAQPA